MWVRSLWVDSEHQNEAPAGRVEPPELPRTEKDPERRGLSRGDRGQAAPGPPSGDSGGEWTCVRGRGRVPEPEGKLEETINQVAGGHAEVTVRFLSPVTAFEIKHRSVCLGDFIPLVALIFQVI